MKLEHAELLADELGMLIEVELRENYSGRGMYGENTSGIVVDSMNEFLRGLGEYLKTADESDLDKIKEIGAAIKRIKTDSMGYSIIIY